MTNLSAWDKTIDMLEPGKLYKFHNVYVQSYRDDKYFRFITKNQIQSGRREGNGSI